MSSALKPHERLTETELDQLTTFEAEVARGLVHRPGYAYEMAKLAERYEATGMGSGHGS